MKRKIIIREGYKGAMYKNGVFQKLLDPGKHELKSPLFSRELEETIVQVDVRSRSLTLKGQEILTADKVAVRISLLVNYRVADPEAALHRVASYEEKIYEDVQLSARRFLSDKTLDEILKDRNEISDFVRSDVRDAAADYGVEITRADVKDLVFPGNLREIMNNVLETERRSEAMLIEAEKKAEVLRIESEARNAAMQRTLEAEEKRAALMRDNPVLLRLKELETYERIGANAKANFHFGMKEFFTEDET